MSDVPIKCPRCEEEKGFDHYQLLEDATLVCPNCSAEFSLTATLETLPDGAEGEDDTFEPEFELPDAPTPEPAATPPPPEMPEPPLDIPAPESRQPVIRTRVLVCSKCNVDWVGTSPRTCPNCGSYEVLASEKSVQQRAQDTLDEMDRGVSPGRAINKLLGVFKSEPVAKE